MEVRLFLICEEITGNKMMDKFIKSYIEDLFIALNSINSDTFNKIVRMIIETRERNNTVFLIGNGGSAATPSHSAGDWTKELNIKTVCLSDNIPGLTAWANDTSYENIFKGPLQLFIQKGDLLIAYSGSGNSKNVLNAVRYAKSIGVTTIGMTGNYKGKKGGELAKLADISIVVNTESMERIEDCHLIINHMIKEYILSVK